MDEKNLKIEKMKDLDGVAKDDGARLFCASEQEIRAAHVTDVYFLKAYQILRAEGLEKTPVGADIHTSAAGIFAGAEEVKRLLRDAGVTIRSLREGQTMSRGETVMQIEGPYCEFCMHETAILGILASSSGWATGARECADAAGELPVACFASRHLHPAVAPAMERAALIGGCSSASNILGARLAGEEPRGTIPHALILVVGDTLRASELYAEHLGEQGGALVSLVDTFLDEPQESVRVGRALGEKLYAVRLDTPGERGGVTPALVRETRARLDQAGCGHVKIFVSGGMTPERIAEMAEAGADAFGVGSYISDADPIDMTMDLKEVGGEPRAKRGRIPGLARNERLEPL